MKEQVNPLQGVDLRFAEVLGVHVGQGRGVLPRAWSASVCRVGTRIRCGSDQGDTESRACEPGVDVLL